MLTFRPELVVALSHRGEYRVHIELRSDDPSSCAWATFHAHEGGVEMIEPPILGTIGEVQAACDAHAAAQPAHPPMRGWPAEVSP